MAQPIERAARLSAPKWPWPLEGPPFERPSRGRRGDHEKIAPLINAELRHVFTSHLFHDIEWVQLPDIPQVCRDASDDKVIATAIYGAVDYLVTADRDLKTPAVLKLLADAGIAVLAAGELIRLLDIGYRNDL